MLQAQLARTATPDLAMAIAELSLAMNDPARAEQYYQMAEQIERGGWGNGLRQPQAMARLLAERDGRAAEAVALAEEAAQSRADIFTMDTLAWSHYRNGQLSEAQAASARATRTGSRDPRIRCHAAVIAAAVTSARAPGATRRCSEWHP
jgi:hypothetical protein